MMDRKHFDALHLIVDRNVGLLNHFANFNCGAIPCHICPYDIKEGGCFSGECQTILRDIESLYQSSKEGK